MPVADLREELLSLVEDAREQVTYLHELGVENLQTQSPGTAAPQRPSQFSSQPPVKATHSEVFSAATDKATISEAPTVSHHRSVTSLPQDSLFGDIAPPPLTLEKSSESLEQIWADIGDCTRCSLCEGRTHIVHTEGNRKARLVFVGEAPGADEDAQARPFVGRAGQLLTKIIEAIGLKREEVLIGNVNRCRPPGNRPPTEEEASMCKPFLLREIAAVQPEVIVVLGNTAMRNLLNTRQGITKLRGQFQEYQGVKVMPTFHPAYLLRDPSKKQETWQDLKKVRDYLDSTAKREN
jgi:DNA polymerase